MDDNSALEFVYHYRDHYIEPEDSIEGAVKVACQKLIHGRDVQESYRKRVSEFVSSLPIGGDNG